MMGKIFFLESGFFQDTYNPINKCGEQDSNRRIQQQRMHYRWIEPRHAIPSVDLPFDLKSMQMNE